MGEGDRNLDAKPDVGKLLAEVDAAVAAKKSQGLYNPVEVRRVEEAAVTLQVDPDAESMERLAAYLRENWDAKACGISTHRAGLSGRLVVGLKRLLHRLTRPYLNVALAQQTAFNNQLVTLQSILVSKLTSMRVLLEQSEDRFDDTEARLTALERRLFSGNAQGEALLARLQRIVEDLSQAGQISPRAVQEVAQTRAASRGASYLAFEDLHRGTREEIKHRQSVYLPHFRLSVNHKAPLLDLGCGRGEFLDLCRDAGLPARGVDANPAMVALCREMGLEVTEADALAYLRAQPPAGLGGILLSQVIEHLTLDQLTELVALCAEKLAPGGVLIAETVNPQTLSTFAGAFYVDLTHNKPVHPEAARFLWRWAGLGEVEILYLSPTAPEHQLEPLPGGTGAPDIAGAFNRNVARLNQLIYGPLDYAVVGRK
jgi:2-polyprenyl-3-methyl-5-hydroxy-6-metoxy-1,4-benzoquinol methylase